ncbi:hypothetical protein [Helicobacter saguini]|uniref:hypothetical protein n=1 Tax=Helicobacter saguini TaxID=1548018 RepID=UPI00301D10E3
MNDNCYRIWGFFSPNLLYLLGNFCVFTIDYKSVFKSRIKGEIIDIFLTATPFKLMC